jgi:hypothetical protein
MSVMTTTKTQYFLMPNGKRLRACGRFENPEILYNEVVDDYYNTPASRSVSIIARWAKISEATLQNILKAYLAQKHSD